MHTAVLLQEVLQAFAPLAIQSAADLTLGAGGHTKALLAAHPEIEVMVGLDRDESALALCREIPKIKLVHARFDEIEGSFDAVLADLGVSSMQLDQPERGFSFMKEGPLDMRMDRSQELTAADVVNTYRESELARIIFEYGEEPASRKIAKALVEYRHRRPIRTTADMEKALPFMKRFGKIHPLTRLFQALRIEVNGELEALQHLITKVPTLLNPGGRLAIITFHSLEDRLVKHGFRALGEQTGDMLQVVTRKPIVASDAEVRANPRSRSAKLRVIERIKCPS